MPGRQVADVVFCLDASNSMKPCFDALRKHVQSFVSGLQSGSQYTWDLRLDYLAYHAGNTPGGGSIYGFQSLYYDNGTRVIDNLYNRSFFQSAAGKFFTADVDEFARSLDGVKIEGDEATFVALDTALDFPWRDAGTCHRILILMTDEALETGIKVPWQVKETANLIEKLHALRVKLFIVGPASDAFDAISAADRSEYEVLQSTHDGLRSANFQQILGAIGKSVSVSSPQGGPSSRPKVQRGLFGQAKWTTSNDAITGD